MNRKLKDRVTDPIYRAPKVEDLYSMDLMDCFKEDPLALVRAEHMIKSGMLAYTILDQQGKPIAVMGGIYLYSKVLEVWAIVDRSVEKNARHYSRATKFLIDFDFDRLNIDRMQVTMLANQKWAYSWARFLGFKQEAVMRKFGEEGTDHILFSKVRD
jgi:hypothetical protein